MGNSFYWWSAYKNKEGTPGRRPKGRGVGPGWEPVLPLTIRKGFFANYRSRIIISLGTMIFCAVVIMVYATKFALLGIGAFLYFFLLFLGIIQGLLLPAHWWNQHQTMMRALACMQVDDQAITLTTEDGLQTEAIFVTANDS